MRLRFWDHNQVANLQDLVEAIESYHPVPDLPLLEKAYRFAEQAHAGQRRASGDPYFTHLVQTALLTCQLHLDTTSVAAALLHDILEDCAVSVDELESEFGTTVTNIVVGVTKLTRANLSRLGLASREEQQAECFRKMLLAMSQDIRVILVKLCDRLHNMRTMDVCSEEHRIRKSLEVKEIYAPLAKRLGIHWLKRELEDACFSYLRPSLYREMHDYFEKMRPEWEEYLRQAIWDISIVLQRKGLSASIAGEQRGYYQIWQELERRRISFKEVTDLLEFKVIVPTQRACYEALGVLHSTWKPVTVKFQDFIAVPKPNFYQALHSTVIGPKGRRILLRICTPEMNIIAENGITARWRYEGNSSLTVYDLNWLRDLVVTQRDLRNSDEFLESVKGELPLDEIYVFTPKGEIVRLPQQATTIDLAYAIHSRIGEMAVGAKVNGVVVELHHLLGNGDIVEILTKPEQRPQQSWLSFARTARAQQKIRHYFRAESRCLAFERGRRAFSSGLNKLGSPLDALDYDELAIGAAKALGFPSEQELYTDLGLGKVSWDDVAAVLPQGIIVVPKEPVRESPLRQLFQQAARVSRQQVGIGVPGFTNMIVRLARCCDPLPGDRIVGVISRGRLVTVHRASCPQVLNQDPFSRVAVEWESGRQPNRKVQVTVHSEERRGLLGEVSRRISDSGIDIERAEMNTDELGKAVILMEVSLENRIQLRKITREIEMVPGVIKVERHKSQRLLQ